LKIIFLDIDGVLNISQTFIDIHKEWKQTAIRRIEIDEFRVELLADLVKETNSKIVLSSSWRMYWIEPISNKAEEINEMFSKYGLEIYSITPRCKSSLRQDEIDLWLSEHDNIESFVIFDDDSFDLQKYIDTRLIKTSFTKDGEMIMNMDDCCGLLPEHIEKAKEILERSEN
jgi:hypothetical protein